MSKALKALEIIKNAGTIYVGCASDIYTRYSFECKEIEKALKALEVIKPCCIIADYKTDDPDKRYELAFCRKICITQEEYNLLKEVLL